jgi:hypothetical protein
VAIVTDVCHFAGERDYLGRIRRMLARNGLIRAVAEHDNDSLFAWLVDGFALQGVSDRAALAYLEKHGNVSFAEIRDALAEPGAVCPKLASFDAFRGCRYQKVSSTCSNPRCFATCPLPRHQLRKGALNQAAYSLYLFVRDRAGGDLIAFIDRMLAGADRPGHPDRVAIMRKALVGELTRIAGVSSKVISMMFADLLLAADPKRPRWVETGASMIAIDTLVHNFLVRTGIHDRLGIDHKFGAACYGPKGCSGVLDGIARAIDARAFNKAFPTYFPRFVQAAIWAFCAQGGHDICNGVRIDDDARCRQRRCPVFERCGRVALR